MQNRYDCKRNIQTNLSLLRNVIIPHEESLRPFFITWAILTSPFLFILKMLSIKIYSNSMCETSKFRQEMRSSVSSPKTKNFGLVLYIHLPYKYNLWLFESTINVLLGIPTIMMRNIWMTAICDCISFNYNACTGYSNFF